MSYTFGRAYSGWPFLAMSRSGATKVVFTGKNFFDFEQSYRPGILGWIDRGIIIEHTSNTRRRTWAFPIRPSLPGFLINTLFYALLAWLPFGATGFTRRTLRRRAGRCVGCGYELAALLSCPECGRPRAERAAPTG